MGAGQPELLAEEVDQQVAWLDIAGVRGPVDRDADGDPVSHSASLEDTNGGQRWPPQVAIDRRWDRAPGGLSFRALQVPSAGSAFWRYAPSRTLSNADDALRAQVFVHRVQGRNKHRAGRLHADPTQLPANSKKRSAERVGAETLGQHESQS